MHIEIMNNVLRLSGTGRKNGINTTAMPRNLTAAKNRGGTLISATAHLGTAWRRRIRVFSAWAGATPGHLTQILNTGRKTRIILLKFRTDSAKARFREQVIWV
jgi:hypothetical protein